VKPRDEAMRAIAKILGIATNECFKDEGWKSGFFGGAAKGPIPLMVIVASGDQASLELSKMLDECVKRHKASSTLESGGAFVVDADGITRENIVGNVEEFFTKGVTDPLGDAPEKDEDL
jgi:hypothetical protein